MNHTNRFATVSQFAVSSVAEQQLLKITEHVNSISIKAVFANEQQH